MRVLSSRRRATDKKLFLVRRGTRMRAQGRARTRREKIKETGLAPILSSSQRKQTLAIPAKKKDELCELISTFPFCFWPVREPLNLRGLADCSGKISHPIPLSQTQLASSRKERNEGRRRRRKRTRNKTNQKRFTDLDEFFSDVYSVKCCCFFSPEEEFIIHLSWNTSRQSKRRCLNNSNYQNYIKK